MGTCSFTWLRGTWHLMHDNNYLNSPWLWNNFSWIFGRQNSRCLNCYSSKSSSKLYVVYFVLNGIHHQLRETKSQVDKWNLNILRRLVKQYYFMNSEKPTNWKIVASGLKWDIKMNRTIILRSSRIKTHEDNNLTAQIYEEKSAVLSNLRLWKAESTIEWLSKLNRGL